MPADRVRITHPSHLGEVYEVSREAFEGRSRHLGWALVDEEPNLGFYDESTDDRDALVAEAAALGIKAHHRAKAETIRRQIDQVKAHL